MKDGFLIVGALNPNAKVGDPKANAAELVSLAEKAAEAGISVLATPELALTTATAGELYRSSCLLAAVESALRDYLDGTAELDLLSFIGLPVAVGGKLYNAAAAAFRGRLLGVVPKSVAGGVFAPAPEEDLVISFAGETCLFGTRQLFTCEGAPRITVACEIGDDLTLSVPPSVGHAAAGATLIVNLSADPETVGRAKFRRNLVAVHSERIKSAYVYAGAGRGESGTDLVFSGHGLIAETGKIVAESAPFSDEPILSATVDLEYILSERLSTPFERPDGIRDKVSFDLHERVIPTPAVPSRNTLRWCRYSSTTTASTKRSAASTCSPNKGSRRVPSGSVSPGNSRRRATRPERSALFRARCPCLKSLDGVYYHE